MIQVHDAAVAGEGGVSQVVMVPAVPRASNEALASR